MFRKGQAAMEFLMTYGWAILAAIIAIGVLAYFGVFSPDKYIGGSAVVNAPFYINAWNAQVDTGGGNSGIVLELRNNGGEDYDISSVTVVGGGDTCIAGASVIAAGALGTIDANCGVAALALGDNFKGDITIVYQKESSSVDLTSTGTITETVTA